MKKVAVSLLSLVACQQKAQVTSNLLSADYSRQRIDPYQIEFSVGQASSGPKFPDSKHILPKVKINLIADNANFQADFYQVQRCPESAEEDLRTSDGKNPIVSNKDNISRIKDYLYVWGVASTVGCRFLDGIHISDPFVDLVYHSGDFFYLIRPCVMAKHSIYDNKRTCHYKFYKTSIVNFEEKIVNEQQQLKSQLNGYSNELEFVYAQVAGIIREKAGYLQKCEFNEAQKLARKRRWAGIAKIALTASAAVVASITMGPQTAFHAGSAAIKLGDKLFGKTSNATLNCPTSRYDRQLNSLYGRAEQTVYIIGQIRHQLAELKLDAKQEPLEHSEIYRQIKMGEVTLEDLLATLAPVN